MKNVEPVERNQKSFTALRMSVSDKWIFIGLILERALVA
jgi:hypothetical protein